MLVRKCDLCGKEVEIKEHKAMFIGYHLPLGQRKSSSLGECVTNRFAGWEPMATDLCHECADKIRSLCIEIAEQNGIDTVEGDSHADNYTE